MRDILTRKRRFITALGRRLARRGSTMSVPELADLLNKKGFRTSYGTRYKGMRGTYTLVSGVYLWLERQDRLDEAHDVAAAFVMPNGEYAYEDEE